MVKKYWLLLYLISFGLFTSTPLAFAQNDSTTTRITSSAQVDQQIKVRHRYNPRKALLMSAALPGLGQIYTKKYWKLPILYIGAGIMGYLIVDNNRKYVIWRDWYIAQRTAIESKLEPPILNPKYGTPLTLDQLKRAKDTFRRYRDLNVILCGVLYALNLADANVTAHLKDFDLSDDLSMSVQPFYQPISSSQSSAGITFTLNFK